jgi:DNA end-binding protein Ku
MAPKKKKSAKKSTAKSLSHAKGKSKSHSVKKEASSGRRGLWKGSISFGLVNIPVILETAQQEHKLHFNLIDKRDNSRVGYKQINKSTGKEIDSRNIVKGYEYEKGEYVLLTDADFTRANPKATRAIDIEDFVLISEVDPMLFDRPYYVLPQKGGEKGYALLREVLKKTEKAAIAKIVLHTVQHLAILLVRDEYIVLELLRFASEVKETHEMPGLPEAARTAKVSSREISVAEQLVKGMSSKWKPDKYKDTYREDIMKMVKAKVKGGKTAQVENVEPPETDEATESNVIDLTALLKKSLNKGLKSARERA